ncbi:MAG TPA: hypothetical protein VII95_09960 [Terriglobales bacterium]
MSKPTLTEAPDYFRVYRPVVGGKYMVCALPYQLNGAANTRYVSPPVADYIAMYILSDSVRYQQELWGTVVQGEETGVMGLVEILIAVSKRRFPNLILNSMYGESFEYGSLARLM